MALSWVAGSPYGQTQGERRKAMASNEIRLALTGDALAAEYKRQRAQGVTPSRMAYNRKHVRTLPYEREISDSIGDAAIGNGAVDLSDRVRIVWNIEPDTYAMGCVTDWIGEFQTHPCCKWCVDHGTRTPHGTYPVFHPEGADKHYAWLRAHGVARHDAWLQTRAMARQADQHAREYSAVALTVTLHIDGVEVHTDTMGDVDVTDLPENRWDDTRGYLASELAAMVADALDVSHVTPGWLRAAASDAIAAIA